MPRTRESEIPTPAVPSIPADVRVDLEGQTSPQIETPIPPLEPEEVNLPIEDEEKSEKPDVIAEVREIGEDMTEKRIQREAALRAKEKIALWTSQLVAIL